MKRLLIFLIIGLLFAIGGVIIGVSSHQVTYQTVSKQVVAHFLADDGASSSHTAYLQMEKDSNFYIINENDFSPAVTSSSFGDGDTISFIYRSVDTNNIDVKAQNTSTHLQGKAYIIEQLSIVDSSGNAKVFSTSEYKQNPQGFYQNNWLLAIPLLAFGLILAGLGVVMHVLGRRKELTNAPSMGILGESEAHAYQMQLGQNNAPTVEMGMLPSQQTNWNQQSYENSMPYQQQAGQFPVPDQFQSWPGQANPAQAAAYSQPLQYPQQAEQFSVPGRSQSWPGQANPAQAAAYSQPLQYQQQPGPEYQQPAEQFTVPGQFQSWSGQANSAQAVSSQPLQYQQQQPGPEYQQPAEQFTVPGQFQSWSGQANPAQAAAAYSQPLQYQQQAGQFTVPGRSQSWPGQANPAQAVSSQPFQYQQQQPGPEYQQQAGQFPVPGRFQSWAGQANPAQAATPSSQPPQYQQQLGPEYQQQAGQFPVPGRSQSWAGQANPAQAATPSSQPPQYQQQPGPEYPQQDGLYEPTQRGNQ